MHKHEWRLLDAMIQRERVALRPAQIITIHDLSQETTNQLAAFNQVVDIIPTIGEVLEEITQQCSR